MICKIIFVPPIPSRFIVSSPLYHFKLIDISSWVDDIVYCIKLLDILIRLHCILHLMGNEYIVNMGGQVTCKLLSCHPRHIAWLSMLEAQLIIPSFQDSSILVYCQVSHTSVQVHLSHKLCISSRTVLHMLNLRMCFVIIESGFHCCIPPRIGQPKSNDKSDSAGRFPPDSWYFAQGLPSLSPSNKYHQHSNQLCYNCAVITTNCIRLIVELSLPSAHQISETSLTNPAPAHLIIELINVKELKQPWLIVA